MNSVRKMSRSVILRPLIRTLETGCEPRLWPWAPGKVVPHLDSRLSLRRRGAGWEGGGWAAHSLLPFCSGVTPSLL